MCVRVCESIDGGVQENNEQLTCDRPKKDQKEMGILLYYAYVS